MRIGFDAKRFFFNNTGLGNYSRDLIRMLERYHPEHSYIKYTPKKPNPPMEKGGGAENTKFPTKKRDVLFSGFWRQKWIANDLVADNIDIFHGLSGEIPVGLEKKHIRSVVSIHDLIFLRFPEWYNPIDRLVYNRKFKYACNNADKVVAISQQTKNDIIHFYNVPSEKIDVIYQGCHPAFKTEKTTAEKEKLRKKYNLPQNFILNVGSIEPRKNAFQIVKAIEKLDVPLIIIGKETKYSQEIKRYIHQKELHSRVLLLQGFTMEELSTIYAMADIFVYPSKYEGFGIPIIEALYSGTPVITNKSGVFREAGGPFSNYINPENPEEISYSIESILTSSTMQAEMAMKGLQYAQRFNDEVIANMWMDCYNKVLINSI